MEYGECKRFPPQVVVFYEPHPERESRSDPRNNPVSLWPTTNREDGCGEFQQKDEG